MDWQITRHFVGTKIIVDQNAYTEIRKWRAVAVVVDVRRPNKVKPIYKKKLFIKRIPRAYLVKGVGLIVHPDIYKKIQDHMAKSVEEQQREILMSAFGVKNGILQPKTSLTRENLETAMKLAGWK